MELYLSPEDIEAIAAKVAEKLEKYLSPEPDRLWSVQELAARYDVCPQTIRNWMEAGKFGPLTGERKKKVTNQGVIEYDNRQAAGQVQEKAQPARRYTHRGNPGKI